MAKRYKISPEIQAVINTTVDKAVKAERLQALRSIKNPYQATERRLYAYPILVEKIVADKEKLARLEVGEGDERSKSIVRFTRTGYRVSPEEMLEMTITDLKASIAGDEHQLDEINQALEAIKNDYYYRILPLIYFEEKSGEEVADIIPCDTSTVWRNRKRLINHLSVRFFGSLALE